MKMNTGEQMRMISEALKQDQRNYLHEVMQGQARIAELEAELATLKSENARLFKVATAAGDIASDAIAERDALKASLKKQLDQCTECAEVYAERDMLKAKASVPDGWKLVAVNASFSDLMYYLDRASVKGYLDRLYDLVEPWKAFDYEYIENAAAPAKPQSDGVIVPRELLTRMRDIYDAGFDIDAEIVEISALLGGEA